MSTALLCCDVELEGAELTCACAQLCLPTSASEEGAQLHQWSHRRNYAPPPSQSGNVSFGGMERVQTKASVTSRADFAHHTIIYKGGNHETINSSSQTPAYPLVRKILLRVPKHREELIAPSRLAPAGAPLSSLRLPHHSNNPEIRGAVIIDTAL